MLVGVGAAALSDAVVEANNLLSKAIELALKALAEVAAETGEPVALAVEGTTNVVGFDRFKLLDEMEAEVNEAKPVNVEKPLMMLALGDNWFPDASITQAEVIAVLRD